MDNFDNGIKRELKNHVHQNIHFTENEREKILESAVKKQQKYVAIKLLTVTAFTLAVFTLLAIPFFANPEDNIIHKISSLPFSDKEPDSKGELPDSLFERKKKDNNQHSENDNSESQKNKNAVTQDEEPNKEVDMPENHNNSEKDQEKNQDESENNPITNETNVEDSANNEANQENVNKEIFHELIKKFNNMDAQISNLVDSTNYAHNLGGYYFKELTKKEEVYNHLLSYLTHEEAEGLWSYRLVESENGLIELSMDGHPDFYLDQPYIINKINDTKFEYVQEMEPGLFGPIISLTFTKIDDQWLISNVSY